MLQQTQVKTVIPYWRRWMRELPTIASLARARPERVLKLWEGLGYYARARNLLAAAQQITLRHRGCFPSTFDEVIGLPGVGRYTAGAICSIAFNQPVPILDGNVIRVLSRLYGIGTNPRERRTRDLLWRLAADLVNEAARIQKGTQRNSSDLNQALMEMGAIVCTARQPRCLHCPVRRSCVAFQTGRVNQLPVSGRKPVSVRRHCAALVLARNGKFLVRQRPDGVVNARLWEFANVELPHRGPGAVESLAIGLGLDSISAQRILRINHSITKHRITLDVYRSNTQVAAKKLRCLGTFRSLKQLQELPLTGAHRKILNHLRKTASEAAGLRSDF